MNFSTILGGIAGGLAGALIWVLVGYFTGYEVGYIAWGIGFLAGVGLRFFAAKSELEESAAQGIAAAVIAIACILAGKFGVVYLHVANERDKVTQFMKETPVTEETMIALRADAIAEKRQSEGETLQWPPGQSLASAQNKEDYPADVWAPADREWKSQSPADREQQIKEYDADRERFYHEMIGDEVSAFKDSFAFWDVLWAFLAVGTAFKIGAGSYSKD